MSATTPPLAPYFLRDLAEGLRQQMFFWGQDVVHPGGNFLVKQGFERLPSRGLQGTSRYRLKWQAGHIELYGACAGFYGPNGGFTFIRHQQRCAVWLSEKITPVPGAWRKEFIDRDATREELYLASLPFLDWLIHYEEQVIVKLGRAHRTANFLKYRKVPKAKAWIEPEAALEWFRCFEATPQLLSRPKHFSTERHAQHSFQLE
ncbi:MAG: hypothetical protein ACON5H_05990 [Akkermansiaceae bacterium]